MLTTKLIELPKLPHKGLYLIFLVLMACFLAGGQTARAEYNIGPSDVLSISVFGEDDLKSEIRVSAEGRITFPLVGVLQVADKNTFQVEKMISDELMQGGFVRNAQVTVNVLEYNSQRVSVLGHVNRPGRYSLESITSLLEVIAMAGGIRETGGNQVIITRNIDGHSEKQIVDLHTLLTSTGDNNLFAMQSGDVIYIPKAPLFYIYGQIQEPGSYPVELDLTVVKALSIGGGLTLRGTQRGIVIKRKDEGGNMQDIDVELMDPVLENDVIFIDERLF